MGHLSASPCVPVLAPAGGKAGLRAAHGAYSSRSAQHGQCGALGRAPALGRRVWVVLVNTGQAGFQSTHLCVKPRLPDVSSRTERYEGNHLGSGFQDFFPHFYIFVILLSRIILFSVNHEFWAAYHRWFNAGFVVTVYSPEPDEHLCAAVAWKLSSITIALEHGISSKCITGPCQFPKL